jgi:sugar transferase (PEP-CTERM/EpsH1 system associated)
VFGIGGHSSLQKILYLTHRVPYPPDKGDRIRTFHLLRQMAKRGRVWLGCLADEPVTPDARAALDGLCERVATVPVGRRTRWLRAVRSVVAGGSLSEGLFASRQLTRVLRGWTAEAQFDVVVASSSSLVPYLSDRALAGIPAVVDLIDVDSQKWLDFASAARSPKKWIYQLEAARVRKLEKSLAGRARAVSVVSRAEADVYDTFTHAGAATVAPNGVDLDYFAPVACEEQPALTFVGALDYWPNEDAVGWFTHQVWPAIRAKFPTAEFRIVGRNPTQVVWALDTIAGIRVIGSVPDVRPFVASAAAVVVPLRLARGVQNKVLEAMAMAKAVVAAPASLLALGTVPGTHLLSASTPQEWIELVCGLLADSSQRHQLGANARQYVERHHHWEGCLQPLLDSIFTIPAPRP